MYISKHFPKTANFILIIAATFLVGLGLRFSLSPVNAAGTIFVKADASGSNNGTSWANAYTSLATALNNANSGDQVWVAAGVYTPGVSENDSFLLENGVEIYGGFSGSEGSLGDRNWETNVTVLSGDIDNNDTKNGDGVTQLAANISGRNSYHVVEGENIDSTAILDGFTITAGQADGPSNTSDFRGAGIYNRESAPILRNLTFVGNQSIEGGAMYNGTNSDAQITSVEFNKNVATASGGAVYNLTSEPVFDTVTFSNNTSQGGDGDGDGGAVYNWQSVVTYRNSTFSNNTAVNIGGAMYTYSSTIDIDDVVFNNNEALFGGGMGSYVSSTVILDDVAFNGNRAINSGGGMYSDKSFPTLNDVTFTANTAASAGGGMYNNEGSDTIGNRVKFFQNTVDDGKGGGIVNFDSNPSYTNVEFRANEAKEGGAISNQFDSQASYTNALFVGNKASVFGGAIANEQSDITLINATISGNNAVFNGGGVFNNGSSPTISNSIIWDNSEGTDGFNDGTLRANLFYISGSADISNSIIQQSGGSDSWDTDAGTDLGNNIDSDPLFKTPINLSSIPTLNGDFNLTSGSPAINAGNNGANSTGIDLAGSTRVEEGTIEMGPYEVTTTGISVSVSGVGFGSVSGPNINCSDSCSYDLVSNDVVTLTGVPEMGYSFLGWTGDCSGQSVCVLTMDGEKTVNAEFGIAGFSLSVGKIGTGIGTITSTNSTIVCGEVCDYEYQFQSTVTLEPLPDPSSTFEGWSGACTGFRPCTVAITDTRVVTAEFTIIPVTVSVSISGTGQGNVTSNPTGIECNFDCTEVYDYGTEVTLTPNPEVGTTFAGWIGDCTGTDPCVVTLTEDLDVEAVFTLNRYTLTVTKIGSGTGRILSSPGAIFCGETCTAELNHGTEIELVQSPDAKPNETITFEGWGGDCSGTESCILTMDQNRSVTVRFESNIKRVYLPLIRRD